MSYRNSGYSSLQRHLDSSNSYSNLSTALSSQQTTALSSQLTTLQTAISKFSTQHRAKIASSPTFRSHFSQLAAELGVDPLGGGAKGVWDKLGLGDWYYALGVQIVDVCLGKRERGGGLVALEEVIRGVEDLRNGGKKAKRLIENEVTEEDIKRAIEALAPLGAGYELIEVGGRKVVRCSPGGLDRDSFVVVEVASSLGKGSVTTNEMYYFVTKEGGAENSSWTEERVRRALEKALMDDGMVWIDSIEGIGEDKYWAPALFDFGSS